MGLNGINLIVGIITGIIMASIIWGVVISLRLKRSKKSNEELNETISFIADLLADIENVSRLYNSNKINRTEFKNTFESKYESINRSLKSSMHLLDIYFVKYVELFLELQNKTVSGEITFSESDAKNQSTESSGNVDITDNYDEPAAKTISSDEFLQIDETPMEKNTAEVNETGIEFIPEAKDENLNDNKDIDEHTVDSLQDIFPGTDKTMQPDNSNSQLPDEKSNKSESNQAAVDQEAHEIDSFEANMPEEFIITETGKNSFKEEQESFEIADQNISEQKNLFEDENSFDKKSQNISVEDFQAESFDHEQQIESIESEPEFSVSSDQSEILSEKSSDKIPSGSSDEEFSMETIMDYDMSNIKDIAYGKNVDSEQITVSDDDSESSKFLDKPEKDEILCETIQFEPYDNENDSIQSEINDNQKAGKSPKIPEEKKGDTTAPIVPKVDKSLPENQNTLSDNHDQDVAITGDDIAKKIDSFFGFKN